MSHDERIYVTQPFLPELDEFIPYLQKIWDNKLLTNGGPFHQQLEQALADYLGVRHLSLFSNGTLALLTALQALQISGEVITTPYSFVATTHSLLWNGLKPVFVDIDPVTLNLDPRRIEAAITDQTTAILPVHCYGTPCQHAEIQAIADRHGLKVIYDAAHAFGVRQHGQSILNNGNLSVLSFHATKVFNTFEGGAIISHDAETKIHIDHLKNFGFVNETTVIAAGINGKMSEVNAAFGLLQLQHIDNAIAHRGQIDRYYRKELAGITGIRLLPQPADTELNYSYFPIQIDADYPLSRDALYDALKTQQIFTRRYFYPLISSFPMYRDLPSAQLGQLPIAESVAERVLCLPIYADLELAQAERLVALLKDPSWAG